MLIKYVFGSNTHSLCNLRKDTLSSLALILQNTKINTLLTFPEI